MPCTLPAGIFSVDRGQACRIGYQWHKHKQYRHLRRQGNRIGRFRELWELIAAPSQKLCLKFKTSHPFGKRPPGPARRPAGFRTTIVDSGQKVAHYSGQNCSGRVVAEWDLGGVSGRLARGLRGALLIRSTGLGDPLTGTGVLWRRTAACEWPATRVSVDLRLDGIRSSTTHLVTGRQRSMDEFDSHGSPVSHGCTGHSGRGDCCRGCVSDETPAAPVPATAG